MSGCVAAIGGDGRRPRAGRAFSSNRPRRLASGATPFYQEVARRFSAAPLRRRLTSLRVAAPRPKPPGANPSSSPRNFCQALSSFVKDSLDSIFRNIKDLARTELTNTASAMSRRPDQRRSRPKAKASDRRNDRIFDILTIRKKLSSSRSLSGRSRSSQVDQREDRRQGESFRRVASVHSVHRVGGIPASTDRWRAANQRASLITVKPRRCSRRCRSPSERCGRRAPLPMWGRSQGRQPRSGAWLSHSWRRR